MCFGSTSKAATFRPASPLSITLVLSASGQTQSGGGAKHPAFVADLDDLGDGRGRRRRGVLNDPERRNDHEKQKSDVRVGRRSCGARLFWSGFGRRRQQAGVARRPHLGQAQKVVAAAEAKAQVQGTLMNIAVIDAGGNLKAFGRMDG
ncbi:heme-binding protein, partial [Rhodoblastus sp.]|uniref:heme-binding protein n=1 Tax=Rhodoblastus sp. TaxID=1962975 RepID=UPI003F960133